MASSTSKSSFHINTPLLLSEPLTAHLGVPVYLKMDALQPSGSFKIRGIGYLCKREIERGKTQIISSSGGNAGAAVAYSGKQLGVKVTVVVPDTTLPVMRQKIASYGAQVIVHGTVWNEAHEYAMSLMNDSAAYIHPFDHADIWEGHTSLIQEIHDSVFFSNKKPGVILCSVGGGGLLCGICEGLHKVGWQDVPVMAVETDGAASFNAAVKAGKLVTLDKITSIAKTLGALRVTPAALEWNSKHTIKSITVTDKDTVQAVAKFLDDHRILVEPSCAASLVPVYNKHPALLEASSVVVEVCGGNMVSWDLLNQWKTQFLEIKHEPSHTL